MAIASLSMFAVRAEAEVDINDMSIEELAAIEVTSVSKNAEPLGDAPSAIYVITHDDIIRSGAPTLPEMLRLAPNLQVAQTSASQYIITARGMSGSTAAQNLPNKLLVLIDGRSVYTPLYSGVYWDMQDILPEDIERIEVISGPGATLWGANAVNGVINVITRKSDMTQGAFASVEAGADEQSASLRYGGQAGEKLSYRFYVRAHENDQTRRAGGGPANDDWWRLQGGFRIDWAASANDALTLQGDAYGGTRGEFAKPDEDIRGRNLLARWNRDFSETSTLQVQAYYDRTQRMSPGGGFAFETYDVDVQHSFALGSRHQIVWGGGARANSYDIVGNVAIDFVPPKQTHWLVNGFVQDSVRLGDALRLVLGLKVEDGPYVSAALLPSARLSLRLSERATLWAAASRAIRSPTPFDREVVERVGPIDFLVGGADFRAEKVTTFELGARTQPSSRLSLSISSFYNRYDDLRSIEITPATIFPFRFGNMVRGRSYGVEAWADYGLAPWWKLSAGLNFLEQRFRFKPGASGLLLPALPGVEQQGDDPKFQASLRSSVNLGPKATFDTMLRYVGRRPLPRVSDYVELDVHATYALTAHLDLTLTARNLLHARHQEYPAPEAYPVTRKILAGLQWRF